MALPRFLSVIPIVVCALALPSAAAAQTDLVGRVVAADGTTGIPDVDVRLNDWSTGWGVASVRTGPDGSFLFASPLPGDYRVYFDTGYSNGVNNQDYVAEYWTKCQDVPNPCTPGVIDPNVQKVSYPARTNLGSFKLSAGGSISGTVCVGHEGSACPLNDPSTTGLPVNLESVVSMGPGWQGPPGAQVESDGRYRIRGVPAPVSYRVRVDTWGTDFSTAYYVSATNSTPFSNLATPVQVEIGGHQQGKDLHLTQGGSISGHVYCGTGEPIPNMPVNANMNTPGVWYGSGAQTNDSGAYLIRGLPPGDYQVRTDGRGQAGSAGCTNPANQTYPSVVPIVGTGEVPGKDFHLANGTTISGKVEYRVAGVLQPVVNMRVSASDYDTGQYVSDGNTDSDGNYTIYALTVGRDYRIQVNTRDNHLDPQFWNFIQETWDNDYTGQGNPVAGGATGIDFVLDLGGAISGRVTAVGGAPLTGVNVSAWSYGAWAYGNSAQTDQNGFYIIRGLTAASYSVYANPQPRNYVGEYYDDVVGGDQWLATPVPVTTHPDRVETTQGIDFELAPGAIIKGKVLYGTNEVPGLRLAAYQNESPRGWSGEVVTDAHGEYEIVGLFSGNWRVVALTLGTPYALQQQDKTVTGAGFPCVQGNRSDCVDFNLTQGYTLEIQAYEDTGSGCTVPVPGLRPQIRYFGGTGEDVSPTGWGALRTDANGLVTVSGLPAASFRLQIGGQNGFVTMYYNNKFRYNEAEAVVLPRAAPVSFCLVRGRTISGRVFDDADHDGVQDDTQDEPGVANVCVNARTPWSPEGSFDYWGCTDGNGDYAITGVLPVYPYPGGSPVQYRVWVNAQGTPYASEYFDRVPNESGPAFGQPWWGQAEIVTVDARDRTGIDFSLGLGGGVQGTVTDSTGAYLAGIRINVNPFDGESNGFGTTTDGSGHYLVTGLAAGSYRVQASDERNGVYVQEYYDNTYFRNLATPLPVAARPTKDDLHAETADFVLAEGGAVEGDVYWDKDGSQSFTGGDQLLANANVSADSYDLGWGLTNVNTNAEGHYVLKGLPAGFPLRMRVNTPSGTNLIQVYYDGPPNGEQGTADYSRAVRVTIPNPGDIVSDIHFAMVEGGSISGRVTDAGTGANLANVNVCAEPNTTGNWPCARTGSDGKYTIGGILPGYSYRVRAGGEPTGHRMEYYNDTTDWNAAALIPATTGGDYPNVNFALNAGGAISGTVVDASGAPILNLNVCANMFTAGLGGCDNTDALGRYLIRGLAAASFRVSAGGGSTPYPYEVYNNQTDNNAATPVPVTPPDETTGINFVFAQAPRLLSGPTPDFGIRGAPTAVRVQVTMDRAAGGACGSAPCVRASFGSSKLHVQPVSLSNGVLTFDVTIDADAPLGMQTLSVINDYAAEDAAAVKTNAFEVRAQQNPPAPTTGDRVYVLENGKSLIHAYSSVDYSVADAVPNDPATAIEVCCNPSDIVLSPGANPAFAYVLGGDRSIGIVDLRLGREVGRIPTDTNSGLHGVAVTASDVYVVDRRLNDRILVFDAKTGVKRTEILLGVGALPWGVKLHPGGRYLYAAVRGSATTPAAVAVIDTTTRTEVRRLATPGISPRGFGFKPDGSRALMRAAPTTYLLNTATPDNPSLIGSSYVLNTRGDNSGVIEVAAAPGGKVLAYVPAAGGRMWVVDATSDTPTVLANLTLGYGSNRFKASSDGAKVFVSHGNSQDLYALDVAELLASPVSVPATRIVGLVAPNQLAVAPIPAGPPASRPTVTGVSPSTVTNGGSDLTVTMTGSRFSTGQTPIVWLKDTNVKGTVTSVAPDGTSLSVTFPATTPTGTHVVVVTNPDSMESGLSPTVALRVDPPAYVHSQTLFSGRYGLGGLDVFASDGSRDLVQTEPFPGGIAVTPDGRLGLVASLYSPPILSVSEIWAQDVELFELDPNSPSFRKVVTTLPYVFGGFEPPVFTADVDDPDGVFGYVPNTYLTDTVSVIDPATRSELDIDNDPDTQSYPVDDEYVGPYGEELPGLNRIHLTTHVTDGALQPQGAALTPDGSFLYVASIGYPGDSYIPAHAARVSIVNTATHEVKELTKAGNGALTAANHIAIPPSPVEGQPYSHVFVAGTDGATPPAPALFVYRTGVTDNEAAFVDRIALDEVPRGMAVSEDGKTVYVALRFAGLVQAIDVTPKAGGGVQGTKHDVALGPGLGRGVTALAVAYDDSLLYVANGFRNEIYVFDIAGARQTDPVLLTTLGARCTGSLAVQPATGNPRLDFVTPTEGPALGGNTVVLMGANFSALSQVRFGSTLATTVLVDSAFRIRAQAPAGTGTVGVTVENPDATTLPVNYTYVPDTTPPVFTTSLFVASQQLTGSAPNQKVTAVLQWATDEEASGRLEYRISGNWTAVTDPAFLKEHRVTLTGLTAGATYQFQVAATNLTNLSATSSKSQQLISAPDTTPPVITGVGHSVTDTTATIVWETNEDATSLVQYDGTVDGNLTLQQPVAGTRRNHSVLLSNLLPNHTYEFRVRSSDASNNGPTTVLAAPPYETFSTVCETDPPDLLSGPVVSYLSNNLVIIAWTTDELSTSFVQYGISSVNEQGVMDVSLVRDHVVFLTNLLPGQAYGFRAGSTDACGNTWTSANPFPAGDRMRLGTQRLTESVRLGAAVLAAGTTLNVTAAAVGFTTPSLPDTTGPVVTTPAAVLLLASDRVQVTVGTNEAASILARYGVASVAEASAFDPSFSQTPSLILAGLSPTTTYRLELVLTDPKGNPTTVPVANFTTPTAPDTTPPTINGLTVSGITQTSATVSWTTNEPAESWVRFGLQGGSLTETASALGLNAAHSIALTGLAAGTAYAFETGSRDASGNVRTVTGTPFRTSYAPPLIASLTPDRAAQGATVTIVINGSRFAANATVGLGSDVTVNSSSVNAAGTQATANVTIGGAAAVGPRLLRVTNPQSGLWAEAPFTVVDTSVPVITISSPASGAELMTPSVTVSGTVSETATVTVNGDPVTLSALTFTKNLTLLGPGAHRINVSATDPSGNRSSTSSDVKYMTLSVDDATIVEGDAGLPQALFNLNLPTTSAGGITVQYATGSGTATPGTDYVAVPSGTVTIPAGYLSYPIAVAIYGERVDEDDETFTLTLTSASGAAIVDGTATGTIRDDDGPPAISIGDVSLAEGNSGIVNAVLTLSLSNPSSRTVTVPYATANGTATAGTDYTTTNGVLTFAPGAPTSQPITVPVIGDTTSEGNETFFVNLGSPTNATLADAQGQVTIQNDDGGRLLSVSDASVAEGNSGTTSATFAVSLSGPATVKVTVRYATQHVTTTNQDLDPLASQLVFQPGQTTKTVAVPVKGDLLDEDDETFRLLLSDATGAPILDAEGIGTIVDNDPMPSLSIADASVLEGSSGTRSASFVVTLSAASGRPVTVHYATQDGTAKTTDADYAATSGDLTFAPGETRKTIAVPIWGDTKREQNETFLVVLSAPGNATLARPQAVGSIRNDD